MKKLMDKSLRTSLLAILSVCIPLAHALADEFHVPLPAGSFAVTSRYGKFTHKLAPDFYAIDMQMNHEMEAIESYSNAYRCLTLGAPILASKSGKVIETTEFSEGNNYGHSVTVANEDGTKSLYGHMIFNSLAVEKNEDVRRGQILGLMGDTGKTIAGTDDQGIEIPCPTYNSLDRDPRGGFYGIHLHFRTLNADEESIPSEPLMGNGKEGFSNIVNTTYASATPIYDPRGHWAKWKNKVPYKVPTHSFSAGSIISLAPKIHSFEPLTVEVGQRQTFKVLGKGLYSETSIFLPGCVGLEWIKREENEQQFACTFSPNLLKNHTSTVQAGFLRLSPTDSEADRFHFKLDLIPKGALTIGKIGTVTVSPLPPRVALVGGKEAVFEILGENLSGDLKPEESDCSLPAITLLSSTRIVFSCTLPHSIINKTTAKRSNGLHTFHTTLISPNNSLSYNLSFVADYEFRIDTFKPLVVAYNQPATFVFTGKNLHLAKALFIESCEDLYELERSDTIIKVSCTPYKPYATLTLFPVLQKKFIHVILKDDPGGTVLFSQGVLVSASGLEDTFVSFEKNKLPTESSSDPIPTPNYSQSPMPDQKKYQEDEKNEAYLDYVINTDPNQDSPYSPAFLDSVGWKLVQGPDGKLLYEPIDCTPEMRKLPVILGVTGTACLGTL